MLWASTASMSSYVPSFRVFLDACCFCWRHVQNESQPHDIECKNDACLYSMHHFVLLIYFCPNLKLFRCICFSSIRINLNLWSIVSRMGFDLPITTSVVDTILVLVHIHCERAQRQKHDL